MPGSLSILIFYHSGDHFTGAGKPAVCRNLMSPNDYEELYRRIQKDELLMAS